LEGCITLPNDSLKWGRWAGKILTGDENQGKIYVIGSDGSFQTDILNINPEDFDLIPQNQSLYACDPDRNMILKLSATFDGFFTGALLITQEGEHGQGGKLFVVYRDAINDRFITRAIPYLLNGFSGHLEHVTFAPLNLPSTN
jgi:hypothetical protein